MTRMMRRRKKKEKERSETEGTGTGIEEIEEIEKGNALQFVRTGMHRCVVRGNQFLITLFLSTPKAWRWRIQHAVEHEEQEKVIHFRPNDHDMLPFYSLNQPFSQEF